MHRLATGVLALACGCAGAGHEAPSDGGGGGDGSHTGSGSVPAPPAALADRVGAYSWGIDPTAWPSTPDLLTWSAGDVATLGSHVLRIAITPADPYGINGSATTLHDIASQPAYAALWADPQWTTIIITAYSVADQAGSWTDGASQVEELAEEQEIFDLGTYLLSFPGKRFIVMPWEGDNALAASGSDLTAWNGYVDWMQSRTAGIADARAAVLGSTSHLYSGLEFNAVRRLDTGAPCDATANLCVISYVAPRVPVDYYSYSSWQSLAVTVPDNGVYASMTADLASALAYIQAGRPAVTAANLIVGEVGSPRDAAPGTTNECTAAFRILAGTQAAIAAGVSHVVLWQVIDNKLDPTQTTFGFGAYKYDGTKSIAGVGMTNLIAAVSPALPTAVCPSVAQGGVINAATTDPHNLLPIAPGDILSIYGKFTTANNVVHFRQGMEQTTVTAGSPWWFESAGQINVAMPSFLTAGASQIYVTSTALDSNTQSVTVQ